MRFEATANSVHGVTAKGTVAHQGTVAADPSILPLGSRIRVSGADRYSGVYVVTDTGPRVTGRCIDIHLPNAAQAKRFGRKRVTVRVLSYGDNQKNGREVTPKTASR
jgi:3D (Asp-Asp-Asp) domain-containing protein